MILKLQLVCTYRSVQWGHSMNTEYRVRISFTEPVIGFNTSFVDREFSTKWMSLEEALEHKAMYYDNATLIKQIP